MPLNPQTKKIVVRQLERFESRINYFYLDTEGNMTVGIGHLLANKAAARSIAMYTSGQGLPSRLATSQEKESEYERVSRLPRKHVAQWYRTYVTLYMKDSDITELLGRNLNSSYHELVRIYSPARGYPAGFDQLPVPYSQPCWT